MSTSNHSLPSEAPQTPDDQLREAARHYVEQLRVFYIHAIVFAVGMIVIFVVNLMTNVAAGIAGEWWAWWSGWALIGWSLAVAFHGLVVRLSRPKPSTSTWAERKVNTILSEANASSLR